MDDEPSPEEKIKQIRLILHRSWLTPDERRNLETELLKLLKVVTPVQK